MSDESDVSRKSEEVMCCGECRGNKFQIVKSFDGKYIYRHIPGENKTVFYFMNHFVNDESVTVEELCYIDPSVSGGGDSVCLSGTRGDVQFPTDEERQESIQHHDANRITYTGMKFQYP